MLFQFIPAPILTQNETFTYNWLPNIWSFPDKVILTPFSEAFPKESHEAKHALLLILFLSTPIDYLGFGVAICL